MSMIGKSLFHYEVSAQIGRGGMGEVYQAKDTKLGRDVAIKVLPEEFALDKDRVTRFQREAKLLASLNHPNIASIYGLEESEGIHFLVMELIEGETLKDRIKTGPIPVEEALKLALQMAEALEAAHENGVIHRDLKPANIKVTPDGKVKILDFGLAKAYAGDQENMSPMDSPTISAAATQQGVILGTAAYMSPEQARGKPVDKRADIWAFGVVLFEMLTGRQTFTGETVSDTLASVLAREPSWQSLPPNLHSRIGFLLERCLEKETKDRISGISDARVEIQKVLGDPSGLFTQPGTIAEPRMKLRKNLPWFAAIILVAIITWIACWFLWHTPQQPRITRFEVELIGRVKPTLGSVALSPDGSRFVYPANGQLYVHALDQLEPTPIPGTEDGSQPFFSPDGESIGFSTRTQLKSVSLTGVAPVVLADVGSGQGSGQALVGVWDSEDRIFFGRGGSYGLFQIPAVGGTYKSFAELGGHEDLDYPEVLPGGKWIVFSDNETGGNWSDANIVAQSIETGDRKIVLEGGHFARYASTGHLVYAQNGNLLAIGFDSNRVEVTGKPVQLIQNIATSEMSGHAQFAIAADGTLAYIPGTASGAMGPQRTLVWVNQEGIEEPLLAKPSSYRFPKLSPDGSKVVLAITDAENQDIWIWDIVRETMTRLTFSEEQDAQPIWTPDGNRIVFFSGREEGGIYWKNADGTGEAELFSSVPDRALFPWCFSRDGSTLINGELIEANRMDIGMLSMEGDHEHKPLLTEEYVEMQPKISPDGRWIAYTASESDNWGVYIRPFPDVNEGKWQVSSGIGIGPLWSPDGKELFYRSPDGIMAVPVDTEPTIKLGKPKILFPDTYISLLGGESEGHAWDIHPNGEKFLMIKPFDVATPEEGTPKPKIVIVRNWDEELKQRVPVHAQ